MSRGSVGWQVRRASPADARVIAAHRLPELPLDDADVLAYADWLPGAMRRGLYLGWVAEAEGAVVAGAGLTLLEWGPTRGDPQPWRGRVVNVWTHPDWRRQGAARQLVGLALQAAGERGIRVVGLAATDLSRPLYASLGFEPCGAELLRRSRHPGPLHCPHDPEHSPRGPERPRHPDRAV
ncbi:GNAT family N-acetyltransferase [Deinococcus radiophilus]|uniref:N-acetyltransferase n=1 Tax=Deinococcus radiophilus TaxID=32062 RepID=A0A431W374_9DEIO|nr:GNAT family N-acetyltransferase [Deinococcus radiophilus]RTR29873.1 N-acetyltransferase [Deinococcus radiophilus]UFA49775.1 GNAT family N-acetyltransferase [Deinococcus radiophilus]